jgi:hypothetical protein
MKDVEHESSVAEAVGFLSTRVIEEARRDSVPLNDVEIKQLSFAEETATAKEIAAANAFDNAKGADEFEGKISKLLGKAFKHDVKNGLRSTWQKHLAALRNHDAYILVMVDQAGIPRPKPSVRLLATAIVSQTLKGRPLDITAGLITVLGVVYFLVLRMGWSRRSGPIFGNFAEHLVPNEQVRGVLLLTWLGGMIWLLVRFRD